MRDNIWVLIYFDKPYKVISNVEHRKLILALTSENSFYEEKHADGRWLKSIAFNLPIIYEGLKKSLGSNNNVEIVYFLMLAS